MTNNSENNEIAHLDKPYLITVSDNGVYLTVYPSADSVTFNENICISILRLYNAIIMTKTNRITITIMLESIFTPHQVFISINSPRTGSLLAIISSVPASTDSA